MVDPGSPAWFVDLPWLAEFCLGFGLVTAEPAAMGPSLATVTRRLGTRRELAQQHGRGESAGIDMVHAAVNEMLAAGALPRSGALRLAAPRDDEFAVAVTTGVVRACRAHGVVLAVADAALARTLEVEIRLDGPVLAPGAVEPVPGELVIAMRSTGPTDGDLPALRARAAELGLDLEDRLGNGDTVAAGLLAARRTHASVLYEPLASRWPGVRCATGDRCLVAALAAVLPRSCDVVWDLTGWRAPSPFGEWFPGDAALRRGAESTSLGCGFLVVAGEPHARRWLQHCADWNEPATVVARLIARQGR